MNLKIKFDRSADEELEERAKRLTPRAAPIQLTSVEKSIHFLRGVQSRASFTLPAFYLFFGSRVIDEPQKPSCAVEGYPGIVLKSAIKYSSLSTLSLCARKIFDHGATGLTGADFGKISDSTLMQVAQYWATKSQRPTADTETALALLRTVFGECSKTDSALLKLPAPLGRRLALLKQYANRSAAHLTMETYEVLLLDCSHVVGAITMIGEIIRSFDDPTQRSTYFDELDEAGLKAAVTLFPATPNHRLFDDIVIEMQARLSWQFGIKDGVFSNRKKRLK